MSTADILGVTDVLTDNQYTQGFVHTANTFGEALRLYDEVKNPKREGWKLKSEHKGDQCYNKRFPIGKIYTTKKVVNAPVDVVFENHWKNIEDTPTWNPTTDYTKRIATIGEYTDVIQYALSDVALLKGKEFVVCRMYRKVDNGYVVVASSFDTKIPVVPKKNRAHVNVIAGYFIGRSDGTTSIEYIVSVELKDKLIPEAILSKSIADSLLKDANAAFKHVEANYKQ